MTTPEPAATKPGTRQSISCPGCGRHDWVTWPVENDTSEWKCFNCEKQFTLRRAQH